MVQIATGTNYPTAIDSFTDQVDFVDDTLAVETNTQSSALEALEAKVGATDSGVVTSHDYILQIFKASVIAAASNGYVIVIDDTVSPRGIKWAANPAGFADPMTTRGDIIYRNPSNNTVRLALGTDGQSLKSNGTDLAWASEAMTTRGDMLFRNSSNETARLSVGSVNQVIKSDGTDVAWATLAEVALISGIYRQAIINGNFEIWQRNITFTDPADTVYTSDRWKTINTNGGGTAPEVTISRDTTIPNANSKYAMKLDVTSVGTANATTEWAVKQIVEDFEKFKGKTISLSVHLKAPVDAEILEIVVDDGVSVTLLSREALTTSYVKYTYENIALDASASKLEIIFRLAGGTGLTIASADNFVPANTGAFYISQVQVNEGSTVLDFMPKGFEAEILECQRYYYKSYDYATTIGTATENGAFVFYIDGIANSDYGVFIGFKYARKMRTSPTVTIYSTGTGTAGKFTLANGDRDVTLTKAGESGGTVNGSNGAVSVTRQCFFHVAADAEL